MEARIPDLGAWLGANALVFMAVATVAGFAAVTAYWYLIVRRMAALAKRSAAVHLAAYVAIASVAAIAGIVLFIELADEVEAGEDIAAFDDAFTASLRTSLTYPTLVLFRYATHLGDPPFLVGVCVITALVLLWKRKLLLAAAWIAVTAGNGLLTRALKALFERTRPIHEHGLLSMEGWSFPSGHASGSLAVYTMLAYVILRGRDVRWWHFPILLIAAALIMLVGLSRAFLQVHYLSDVLAGYLVAGSWLAICIAAVELVRVRQGRARPRGGM